MVSLWVPVQYLRRAFEAYHLPCDSPTSSVGVGVDFGVPGGTLFIVVFSLTILARSWWFLRRRRRHDLGISWFLVLHLLHRYRYVLGPGLACPCGGERHWTIDDSILKVISSLKEYVSVREVDARRFNSSGQQQWHSPTFQPQPVYRSNQGFTAHLQNPYLQQGLAGQLSASPGQFQYAPGQWPPPHGQVFRISLLPTIREHTLRSLLLTKALDRNSTRLARREVLMRQMRIYPSYINYRIDTNAINIMIPVPVYPKGMPKVAYAVYRQGPEGYHMDVLIN